MTPADRNLSLSAEGRDDPLSEDSRVLEVVQDYLGALESGSAPNRESFINRYPELAGVVSDCLDSLEMVHAGVAPSSKSRGPGRNVSADLSGSHPGRRLGDFQILHELARGGMGIVYEAMQLSLGRRVALKVLPFAATIDPRQLQRFKIEAQAAALLHHTHIVPIYAVGCERGVHFYAMQLIEGQSLAVVISQLREKQGRLPSHSSSSSRSGQSKSNDSARLDSTCDLSPSGEPIPKDKSIHDPLSPGLSARSTVDISAAMTTGAVYASDAFARRVAKLMVQAADALEHAHRVGVIHRDIKPANLLVDTNGDLWITDFGLAQLQADNGLTRSGDLLGTFRYMSPEQTSGQRTSLDHRTDVYSLGATFYELLTLEPAFAGDTHQELLYEILHGEPRSLRNFNSAVSPELETIIFKALSKSATERYASAGEFAVDIQRYLDHQPILARRPSLVDRARKWSRRHPGVLLAGMLLLFVTAAASLISNRLIVLEQAKTTAALEREMARAREAELRFQQARQAVDLMFQVSEEELVDKPTESARKRILEIVLGYYQDFIEQRRDDPVSQAELATVQEKVKGILHELNVLQRDMYTRLLSSEAVQQELKLSDDQQSELAALLKSWSQEHHEFRELGSEERRARMVAAAEAHELALANVLTPEQLERYKQITLQSLGLFAFKEPEVAGALKLTSEQRTKVRDIEREMFGSFFRRGPGGPGGPGDMKQKDFGPKELSSRDDGPGDSGRGPRRHARGDPGDDPNRGGPDGPRDGDSKRGDPKHGEPRHGGPRHDGPGGHGGDGMMNRFGAGDKRAMYEDWTGKVLAILDPDQLARWKELTGEKFADFGDARFMGPGFGPPRP